MPLTLRGLADATTNAAAGIISILLTNRIGRAENIPLCPNLGKRPVKRREEPKTELCTLPMDTVQKTLLFTSRNVFIAFLFRLFGEETAKNLSELYLIGTTKDGYTIFYQFDILDRCRSGKIIPYNPETGHRIKDDTVPPVMWGAFKDESAASAS